MSKVEIDIKYLEEILERVDKIQYYDDDDDDIYWQVKFLKEYIQKLIDKVNNVKS